jgi:hypothetical protein
MTRLGTVAFKLHGTASLSVVAQFDSENRGEAREIPRFALNNGYARHDADRNDDRGESKPSHYPFFLP